jgi:cytochrome c biogenesis protein ResB
MRAGLIILCILTLLMIAGAIPVKDGSQTAIFSTPVFILAAAALAVALIIRSVRNLHARKIPFLLCHLGIVLILAGALVRFVRGENYEVTIPVASSHRALNLRMPDGTARPLGFGLSVTDFTVEFYDAVQRQVPRHYEAQLEFALPDDTMKQAVLAVNRPVFQGGWWFYLQSYDAREKRFVIVRVKRDPGLPAVKGGIWMVMIGTAALCFRKRGET